MNRGHVKRDGARTPPAPLRRTKISLGGRDGDAETTCGGDASNRRAPTASSPPRREVVEFFLARATAEAMIREAREDEPVLTEDLRVEAIELPYLQQHVPRS